MRYLYSIIADVATRPKAANSTSESYYFQCHCSQQIFLTNNIQFSKVFVTFLYILFMWYSLCNSILNM